MSLKKGKEEGKKNRRPDGIMKDNVYSKNRDTTPCRPPGGGKTVRKNGNLAGRKFLVMLKDPSKKQTCRQKEELAETSP